MRLRQLVHEMRVALHVSKVCCDLSDADLECMLRHAIEDVGDRRREHVIVECALGRARHVCDEMMALKNDDQSKRAAAKRPVRRRATRRPSAKKKKRDPRSPVGGEP